jgi:hypothetical protein
MAVVAYGLLVARAFDTRERPLQIFSVLGMPMFFLANVSCATPATLQVLVWAAKTAGIDRRRDRQDQVQSAGCIDTRGGTGTSELAPACGRQFRDRRVVLSASASLSGRSEMIWPDSELL